MAEDLKVEETELRCEMTKMVIEIFSFWFTIQSAKMPAPVVVMQESMKREQGGKVQRANIQAAKTVADIIRTTLGPRSMLKMLLNASGGIVVTNDGNAILRELDLAHPAAKSMIELSRTQDEEVGDGTTSVIVLGGGEQVSEASIDVLVCDCCRQMKLKQMIFVAGEMLHVAEAYIDKKYHPTVICRAYAKALEDAVAVLDKIAMTVDVKDDETMLGLVESCIGTKFTSQFGDLISVLCLFSQKLAIKATRMVGVEIGQGLREVDIKKYIKVEKVPGGQLEDSVVLSGVMMNKDVVAPGKMKRKIVNPRIILLDCPLEYKKGENQTNAELLREEDWTVLLKMEEEYIENMCAQILKFKPDVVITEKGLSDLACHYLSKAGVSAIRRLRKPDNNRIAKACGAVIVNRPDELQESDVGTGAGLFEVKKIGDEFFTFIVDCKDPKACTILLRGASKDLLNEVERNLQDAMSVARNIIKCPKLVPGGGGTELTVSAMLKQKSSSVEGIEKWPYEAAAIAFEAIPRTLAQNCGVNVIRTMTALQGKHANGENAWMGIDGNTGEIADMKERKIWDSYVVKAQAFKTAIEAACLLLRIDDIVSGIKKKQAPGASQGPSKPKIDEEGDADNDQLIPE
ncbi:T-complex protein 1 subunit gamma [Capsicum annuum]|nr:T-complex protein 1 subunit gamma [Capsicum annuum]